MNYTKHDPKGKNKQAKKKTPQKITAVSMKESPHPVLGAVEEIWWGEYESIRMPITKHVYNDKNGKWEKIPQIHADTGYKKTDSNGKILWQEEVHVWAPFNRTGGWKTEADVPRCFFKVYEKTPQYIKDHLKNYKKSGDIWRDAENTRRLNPEAAERDAKHSVEISAKNDEIENLKAQLKKFEGK